MASGAPARTRIGHVIRHSSTQYLLFTMRLFWQSLRVRAPMTSFCRILQMWRLCYQTGHDTKSNSCRWHQHRRRHRLWNTAAARRVVNDYARPMRRHRHRQQQCTPAARVRSARDLRIRLLAIWCQCRPRRQSRQQGRALHVWTGRALPVAKC
jgi:hypothetical protein